LKKGYDRRVTKKDVKLARQVARDFGFKIRFTKWTNYASTDGWFSVAIGDPKDRVNIQTKKEFWSTVFHELCHLLCIEQGFYPSIHNKNWYKQPLVKLKLVAWKSERFVDRYAEALMKFVVPEIPFQVAYTTEEDKKWLYKSLENYYARVRNR